MFAAMGITNEEAMFFRQEFERTGASAIAAMFLNLADNPAIEARYRCEPGRDRHDSGFTGSPSRSRMRKSVVRRSAVRSPSE